MPAKPIKVKNKLINEAKGKFGNLLERQWERVEEIKKGEEWLDFSKLPKIRIGICGGDGIGPYISKEARRALEFLLRDEVKRGKIELVDIEGLTIENRFAHMKPIPDDVLAELKKCPAILKGPTETPQKGDPRGNIESANVAMRKYLDLFANVRPFKVPELNIDWVFFRENTEDVYAVGTEGFEVGDIAVDFKIISIPGTERIVRAAFDYAKKNGIKRLTVITKANVVKTTDGIFSEITFKMAKDYPDIVVDEWYIDIMTAKLIDPARRSEFRVFVCPNLYGDILTDEAAQIQGGVGTAGAANIGKRYAMFEAIHGSGTRMVKEGRAGYADPSSLLRAVVLMLQHIGYPEKARKLEQALDICCLQEKKVLATGKKDGATAAQFTDYLMEKIESL
ncbi:MAG: isocitrate/isopropylmalate family dehydrogenase [Candidatus Edwardsbacteria bacterium]